MNIQIPPHIKYTRQLPETKASLSNSCAESMSIGQLLKITHGSINSCKLHYASVAGSQAFRESVLTFHSALNKGEHGLTPEHVVSFCGAQEALAAIYKSVLLPGDEVIVTTPSYPSLVYMAKQIGCRVKQIQLKEAQQWRLSFSEVKKAISEHTKLIVLNSPHNPCGSIIDKTLRQEVLSLAKRYDCYLLSDDVSQASNYLGQDLSHDYLSYEKAISVSVMSKSFGLAGIRVGWVISRNEALLDRLLAFKTQGSICTSIVDEQLASLALRYHDKIVERNNQIIHSNYNAFQQFVTEYAEFISWCPPQAGILSVAHIKTNAPIETWSFQLAKHFQVLVLPACLFGLEGNYVRIGLGQLDFEPQLKKLANFFTTTT